MDYQEAFKYLNIFDFKKMSIQGEAMYISQFLEACSIGSEAISKQIPKKMIKKGEKKYCICGKEIEETTNEEKIINYCSICGQKIE